MKRISIILALIIIGILLLSSVAIATVRGESYTIGFWKNHDWETRVYPEWVSLEPIYICGIQIPQSDGQMIMKNANNKNFSMLIAQLIAAKINAANGASPTPDFDEIEGWLKTQIDCTTLPKLLSNYDNSFVPKTTQKNTANEYKDILDEYNNHDFLDNY